MGLNIFLSRGEPEPKLNPLLPSGTPPELNLNTPLSSGTPGVKAGLQKPVFNPDGFPVTQIITSTGEQFGLLNIRGTSPRTCPRTVLNLEAEPPTIPRFEQQPTRKLDPLSKLNEETTRSVGTVKIKTTENGLPQLNNENKNFTGKVRATFNPFGQIGLGQFGVAIETPISNGTLMTNNSSLVLNNKFDWGGNIQVVVAANSSQLKAVKVEAPLYGVTFAGQISNLDTKTSKYSFNIENIRLNQNLTVDMSVSGDFNKKNNIAGFIGITAKF